MPSTIAALREDARRAFDAAVDAVQPERLLPQALSKVSLEIPQGGRLVVACLGKAAPGLASSWCTHRPVTEDHLVVFTPHGTLIPPNLPDDTEFLFGAHPLPDGHGECSARRLQHLAAELGSRDRLLVLLSGGASALLALPVQGLSLADLNATTNVLLRAGATISELNTIRREILVLAGGGLHQTAWPAQVTTLVLSDVPGGSLYDIASGPTLQSPTGVEEAMATLDRLRVLNDLPASIPTVLRQLGQSRPDDGRFEHNEVLMLGENRTAVDAATSFLQARGYRPVVERKPLVGEASARGRELATRALDLRSDDPTAFVFGGETTVRVKGAGVGGRNSELCLAAAIALEDGAQCVVLSAGTDGIDGTSQAAGGLVDPQSTDRIRSAGLDPHTLLRNNDSATALSAAGDAVMTGPTGTNVSDIMLILAGQ